MTDILKGVKKTLTRDVTASSAQSQLSDGELFFGFLSVASILCLETEIGQRCKILLPVYTIHIFPHNSSEALFFIYMAL